MDKKYYLGIDPGAQGAAGIIDSDGQFISVADYPGDEAIAANLIIDWNDQYRFVMAAIEQVHSMPKQGVSSMFKFGSNYGAWKGILAALKIPYLNPTPQTWAKGLIKKSDGPDTKSRSLAVARRMWPMAPLKNKGHHGRAEALLLAYFARATF